MSERVELPVVTIQELSYEQQAYFILTLIQGSWIVNAMWEQLQEEEFCKRIVNEYAENVEVLNGKSDLHEWINEDDHYWDTHEGAVRYYQLALQQCTDQTLQGLYHQMLRLRAGKAIYSDWRPVAEAINSRWAELDEIASTIPPKLLDELGILKGSELEIPIDEVGLGLSCVGLLPMEVEPITKPCSCEMNMLMMSGCQCNGL